MTHNVVALAEVAHCALAVLEEQGRVEGAALLQGVLVAQALVLRRAPDALRDPAHFS